MIRIKDIIPVIEIDGNLNNHLLEKLMRKFELNKKLFTCYDDDLSKPLTSEQIGKDIYSQLAVSFCLYAYIQRDVRFYNTALKIGDHINIDLPEIKF